ncbi:transcriptional regulator, TetR family [Desulfarculus baarsii DSM 2075]|uniref:Transcriptional regulator, TetR family n=1 Tax=Desulfarculus baarsii (strain ATCC 33931 / DSM 2075 / LMG 7858 / VKM B-1802 / 2st14) TaxID=644282 RepID=E1QDE7_DESB2|nr:TetR/AcrR family transcriptional regulator [Desulfarculus baarsii]ADK83466.1 transcriptional regulator, TetR family [Desulfarculus baarsii DSM 2075]
MAQQKRTEARKEQILQAAEKVFAAKGFHQATVSEVAKEAGLSDATIYEYFSTKEELLFSIPLETTRRGAEIMEFHLGYIRGAANKIRSIIYHYLWFYKNHPDYASVALMILKPNRGFLQTEAYDIYRKASGVILDVVRDGVQSGEFRPDVDGHLVRHTIMGAIEHIVVRELLHESGRDILENVDPLTDMVIGGIKAENDLAGWNIRVSLEPPAGDKNK